ncbi:YheC/YheD family protein [Paenibacillus qinlingensis]|uniref:Glutathione synthase/RimK-type ligase-like ATP-grasp enzyme n=1 Tax=Paenibacillus qinlingensis TaxID=1837343 RepID=A0ABU1NWH0_9BACL|nr:YheC/YheD family protein [Paenibacillus qinlingensis]MDR6551815.1 glutathione synthase/RimK-type ligase-like ATP-grasp enzyme [Paenibacillus qinlingensis]
MVYWNNKLGKYKALLTNEQLALNLPPTNLATEATVERMLGKYHVVYLKPSHGTGGHGIFKLSRANAGYRLENGTRSRSFSTFKGTYVAFQKAKGKKTYLVQKGIPLLQYQGLPFDLRIMVQRNRTRKWEVTGIVGRLAMPNKIVTNYHSGGRPMPAGKLLSPFIPKKEQVSYVQLLKDLGVRTSKHMSRIFPNFRSYGVDIGIDKEMKPWIIEVNTRPDKYIFNALSDKRMYRKILLYERFTLK